jgi:hypothetical protein
MRFTTALIALLGAAVSVVGQSRGTASVAPFVGLVHSEWAAPSRLRIQPCCRR